jgi:hypothetical protein
MVPWHSFSWHITPNSVVVHLNQSGFASNLVESFFQDSRNPTPTATPYCSGVPINSIAPSTNDDDSPAQFQHTATYQNLIGSIGWLLSSTCPNLAAFHSFLALYSNKPSVGHMKAALYALHYIYSMHDYDISFTSNTISPMHCYIHFPPSTDIEAYVNDVPLQYQTHPLCLLTGMHVGAFQLGMLLLMVPSFLYSNSEV